jgi:hypothetical protein
MEVELAGVEARVVVRGARVVLGQVGGLQVPDRIDERADERLGLRGELRQLGRQGAQGDMVVWARQYICGTLYCAPPGWRGMIRLSRE